MLTPLLASFFGNIDFSLGALIGLAVPVVAIISGVATAIFAMHYKHRQRELWHETARIALEKGQPVPPMPMEEMDEELVKNVAQHASGQPRPNNDFRAGLILIGVGVGLYLFFVALGATPIRFVGAIPGFIGVALVLHGLLHALLARKAPAAAQRPPQP